ncbi:tetratricopeptide repeat-containing sulfotransferase family protein [Dyella sp.]|uniref:tetratricopeptide repeat-containing sulfotransferase family protein n=1 Tax=Dyella sp. TaxID=1869338 RepID=UPI002ED31D3A
MTDPAHVFSGLIEAFNRHAWPATRQAGERLLTIAPDHPMVCYMTGIAAMELGDMTRALDLLYKATQIEPGRPDFATQYAKALALVRLMRDARLAADRAMALNPTDPGNLDTLGVVFTQTHAHDLAARMFRRATELVPRHAPYRFNLATALVAEGDIDEAERQLEASIAIDPRYWKAHLTLAQLRKQTPSSNHLERLEPLLAQHGHVAEAQTYLHMAMAKEYEDLGDFPNAFRHFTHGKAAGKNERGYSIDDDEAIFRALENVYPLQDAKPGSTTREPIFIVGMPRTGTTLLERILSSHPDVYSAGELQNFAMAYKYAAQSPTPTLLDPETIGLAHRVDWQHLGETYLSSTRPATGNRPHFIDKLPHNFLFVGFIAQALPHAKIVCLRRDPVDTCLSNFRQLFAATAPYYGYSFDLLDTGRYYVMFDRLMAHWRKAFPGRVLEVQYESLVDNQEAISRELLAFCELPWDDACLRFEDNPAPVNTASAVQVRAPVYRTAMKRWKKYEPQLGELLALLRDAGIAVD